MRNLRSASNCRTVNLRTQGRRLRPAGRSGPDTGRRVTRRRAASPNPSWAVNPWITGPGPLVNRKDGPAGDAVLARRKASLKKNADQRPDVGSQWMAQRAGCVGSRTTRGAAAPSSLRDQCAGGGVHTRPEDVARHRPPAETRPAGLAGRGEAPGRRSTADRISTRAPSGSSRQGAHGHRRVPLRPICGRSRNCREGVSEVGFDDIVFVAEERAG